MKNKKYKDLRLICKKCKSIQQPNLDKSNHNWNVYDNKCTKCGGKLTLKLT